MTDADIRAMVNADLAERIQPQPDEARPIATVIAGAVIVLLLVAGFLNIPIWSN